MLATNWFRWEIWHFLTGAHAFQECFKEGFIVVESFVGDFRS